MGRPKGAGLEVSLRGQSSGVPSSWRIQSLLALPGGASPVFLKTRQALHDQDEPSTPRYI